MNVRKINSLLESAKRELRESYGGWEVDAIANLMDKIADRIPSDQRHHLQSERRGNEVRVMGEGRGGDWQLSCEFHPEQKKQILHATVNPISEDHGRAGSLGDGMTFDFTPSTDPNGTLMDKVARWVTGELKGAMERYASSEYRLRMR